MISIRSNSFETNSSSTHSICIPKNNVDLSKFKHVDFTIGEYGWEFEDVPAPSYLYTAILNYYRDDTERYKKLCELKYILDKHNIEYWFESTEKQRSYSDRTYEYTGNIDHCDFLGTFLEAVFHDEDLLLRYLYCGRVYTGNDNTYRRWGEEVPQEEKDCYLAYNKSEPDEYDYFYKGN